MNAPMKRMVKTAQPIIRARPIGPRRNLVNADLAGTRRRIPWLLVFVGTNPHSRMPTAEGASTAAGAGIKMNIHPVKWRADGDGVLHVDSQTIRRTVNVHVVVRNRKIQLA